MCFAFSFTETHQPTGLFEQPFRHRREKSRKKEESFMRIGSITPHLLIGWEIRDLSLISPGKCGRPLLRSSAMIQYKKSAAKLLSSLITELSAEQIENLLERPPKADQGDLAFPCFQVAKSRKK